MPTKKIKDKDLNLYQIGITKKVGYYLDLNLYQIGITKKMGYYFDETTHRLKYATKPFELRHPSFSISK